MKTTRFHILSPGLFAMQETMKSDISQSIQISSGAEPHEWLSALADGQAQALDPGCAQWREGALARRTWHTYHLIGDVMRSEDLASDPAHDAAFIASLRNRLAQEPVVLAPASDTQVSRPSWRIMPKALVAGLVLATGVLVVSQIGPRLAPGSNAQVAAASGAQATALQVRTATDGQALIIDPRLNEFLRAHQSAVGGIAAPAPGGSLRRAEMIVPVPAGR